MLAVFRVFGWALLSLAWLLCLDVSILSVSAAQAAPAEASAPVLTLEEAVTTALANNRNAKIASLAVDSSTQQYLLAKTKRFPSIKAYTFGGESLTSIGYTIKKGQWGTYSATGPIPDHDINVSTSQTPTAFVVGQVSQPLLGLHKVGLNIKAAKLAVAQAGEQSRSTRESVSASVRQAYYGVVQAQEAADAAAASVKQYEELDRLTDEYVKEKTALLSDSLQVKAKLAQERLTLMQAEDKVQSSKESLNDLLGRDIDTPFRTSPIDELLPPLQTLQAVRQEALSKQPAVKSAGLTVKQAEVQKSLARAQYLPDLNVSLRYMSPFGIDFLPSNIAAVGMELRWDPFDWGGRRHAVEQKSIAIEQSKHQLEETKAEILVNVDNEYRSMEEARAAVSVAKLNRRAAHEKLRESTQQYNQKTILLRDVLQQQAAAQTADAQYRQSIAAFWVAKANLDKAIGEE